MGIADRNLPFQVQNCFISFVCKSAGVNKVVEKKLLWEPDGILINFCFNELKLIMKGSCLVS